MEKLPSTFGMQVCAVSKRRRIVRYSRVKSRFTSLKPDNDVANLFVGEAYPLKKILCVSVQVESSETLVINLPRKGPPRFARVVLAKLLRRVIYFFSKSMARVNKKLMTKYWFVLVWTKTRGEP